MDGKPWTPLAAAAATFALVAIIGIVVAIPVIHGDMHAHAFERGSSLGQGVGILAAFAAAVVYFIQKKRTA